MKLEEFETSELEIVEIFKSISGEGISAGEVVSFVRVAGCNLRCNYCDTTYAYQADFQNQLMTAAEVLARLKQLNCNQIICTGGEPLELNRPKRYLPLYLAAGGFGVRIESNGSWPVYSPQELAAVTDSKELKLDYTLDVKLPSSGMEEHNILEENFVALNKGDELKFVVANQEDLNYSLSILKEYQQILATREVVINFSPVFGEFEADRLVEFLKKEAPAFFEVGLKLRLSLQIHKLIWEPESRGV
ncbi:radical SAM protein [Fuchsiella alkaliacetigena]|uniref:radical SAM protein n=1 Tax=Fuchsiella alkaliacetigena TaxID=957042 RepID=UPI00200A6197|nr:radical SAM protein [Fuchsiella alkaliacetigena]MCK8824926.1 radical SAM protein [Fuchsiella alkaliacetigena]